MTENNNKEQLHIAYGGMTLGSLLRKLRADPELAEAREEILKKMEEEKKEREKKTS